VKAQASGEQIQAYLQQGAQEMAWQTLQAALEAQPEAAELWYLQGQWYQRNADPATAVAAFEQALNLDPTLAVAHSALGLLCLRQQALKPACQHLEAARAFAPEQPEHTLNLLEAYLALGDLNQATLYLSEAFVLAPDSSRTFLLAAQLLAWIGQQSEAESAYWQSLELEPQQIQPYLELAKLLLRQQRYLQTQDLLLTAHQNLKTPYLRPAQAAELQRLWAQSLYWQGDWAQARTAWREALELDFSLLSLSQFCLGLPLIWQEPTELADWETLLEQGLAVLTQQSEATPDLIANLNWPLRHLPPAWRHQVQPSLGAWLQTSMPPLKLTCAETPDCQLGLVAADLNGPEIQDLLSLLLNNQLGTMQLRVFYLQPSQLPDCFQTWSDQFQRLPAHGPALVKALLTADVQVLAYLSLAHELLFAALQQPAPCQLWLSHSDPDGETLGLAAVLKPLHSPLPASPQLPVKPLQRRDWQLPKLAHLYGIWLPPQFWLPELDALLLQILQQDRKAFIVGLQLPDSGLHTRLMQRHSQSLGELARRVRWLALDPAEQVQVLSLLDLLLDLPEQPQAWLGFQALAQGVPVLSWQVPEQPLATHWLTALQLPEQVLGCPQDLAQRACEIVTKPNERAMLKAHLQTQSAHWPDPSAAAVALQNAIYTEWVRVQTDDRA